MNIIKMLTFLLNFSQPLNYQNNAANLLLQKGHTITTVQFHPCIEYEHLTLEKKAGYTGISKRQEAAFEKKRNKEYRACLKICANDPFLEECSFLQKNHKDL